MAYKYGEFVLEVVETVPEEVWMSLEWLILASEHYRGQYQAGVISCEKDDKSESLPVVSFAANCSRLNVCMQSVSGHWHLWLTGPHWLTPDVLQSDLTKVAQGNWIEGG